MRRRHANSCLMEQLNVRRFLRTLLISSYLVHPNSSAVSASPLVPGNDMPFIRDPLCSLSGLPTCLFTCFLENNTTRWAGNSEPGSLFVTRDSAKQRQIEQNHHGHRRWSEQRKREKKEEGRKMEEEEPRISSTQSDSL